MLFLLIHKESEQQTNEFSLFMECNAVKAGTSEENQFSECSIYLNRLDLLMPYSSILLSELRNLENQLIFTDKYVR